MQVEKQNGGAGSQSEPAPVTEAGQPQQVSYEDLPDTLGKKGWLIVGTLMLSTIAANIGSTAMFAQGPVLAEEFGKPLSQVVWTMVGYYIVATGIGGIAGALGAIFGSKRMIMVCVGLLFVGSLLAALAPSLEVLIGARVLQGSVMAMNAISAGVVAVSWRGAAMRKAMSMVVFAIGAGAVLAYVLSGIIWQTGGSWRILFWILAAAAAISLVMTVFFIKETPRSKTKVDFVGCLGLVAWAVLILLPVSQANSWGWGSSKVLIPLFSGVVILILWAVWLLVCKFPLLDLRLMRRPGVWQGAVVWFTVISFVAVPATAMPYLIQAPVETGFGLGKNMLWVCAALALTALAMSGVSLLTPLFMGRLGGKYTMLLGMLFGLSGFGLAFIHGSIWLVFLWLFFIGVPSAFGGSASYALAAEAVPPEKGILVSTIYGTTANVGASFSSAIVGYVLTLRSVEYVAPGAEPQIIPADETFTWSQLIVGVLAVICMVAILSIRTKRLRVVS